MTTETVLKSNDISYVQWSAIIAGTVLALAISLVLLQFGSAVGVANIESLRTDAEITAPRLLTAGIFVLVIQILASICGGYIAGRMRTSMMGASEHEREVRDGMHGLLVWATGTVAVVIAVSIASALAGLVANQAVETPRPQDVLDREHTVAIILGFSAAATSLVSAVASWVAATKGGDHRDRAVDYSRFVSFRKV
jgi:hypothetical protein